MSDGTGYSPRWRLTRTHKRLLGGAGTISVVVAVFVFVLPQIADYREVVDVLGELRWQDWLLLVGATVLNLATFPPPWMAALPGLGYRQAMAMTQASTALAVVSPAGAAGGVGGSYSMVPSWGGGRGGGDGGLVLDAPLVGVRIGARRPCRGGHRSLEPTREPRVSGRRPR